MNTTHLKIIFVLLIVLASMNRASFAQASGQYLEPTGLTDVFINDLMWYHAQQYAIDELGAPGPTAAIHPDVPKNKWGPSNFLAEAESAWLPDGSGFSKFNTITLYPTSLLYQYPELITTLEGVEAGLISDEEAWEFFKVLISMTMFHELLHHCYGLSSDPGMEEEQTAPFSCQHASIDFAVFTAGCSRATYVSGLLADALEDIDGAEGPEEVEDLQDHIEKLRQEKRALCRELAQLSGKWNDPDAAKRMRECIDGKAQMPEPAENADYPLNGCPGGYPSLPSPPADTDSGFENDQPFTPCEPCGEGQ